MKRSTAFFLCMLVIGMSACSDISSDVTIEYGDKVVNENYFDLKINFPIFTTWIQLWYEYMVTCYKKVRAKRKWRERNEENPNRKAIMFVTKQSTPKTNRN